MRLACGTTTQDLKQPKLKGTARVKLFTLRVLRTKQKKLSPSGILREAKVAYYARNMIEAGRFVLFFVKAT